MQAPVYLRRFPLAGGSYTCSRPATPLPRIISGTSSKASIEAIRRYFCSEYTAQLVASKAGIAFEELVSGSYKLVIEPIAYLPTAAAIMP